MLKRILLFFGLTLLLLVVALAAIVIKPQLLRPLISEGGQRFAGLEIAIGQLSSHRDPLRLSITELEIRNPAWPQPQLLKLQGLDLQLLRSPFSEQPFWALTVADADIYVAQNENGDLNWLTPQLAGDGNDNAPEPEQVENAAVLPTDFNFRDIHFRNINLHWQEAGATPRTLTLKAIDAERTERAKGDLVLQLAYRDQPLNLRTNISFLDPIRGVMDYQIQLEHADFSLESAGRLSVKDNLGGSALTFNAALTGVDQLNILLAELDTALPTLPNIQFSGALTIDGGYQLDDLTLLLDEQRIEGSIYSSADFNSQKINLKTASIDVDQLLATLDGADTSDASPEPASDGEALAAATAPAEAAPEPTTDPEQEFDWQWLKNRKITLDLEAGEVKASGWQLTTLDLNAAIDETISARIALDALEELATQRLIAPLSADITLAPLAEKTRGADAQLNLTLTQGDIRLSASGPTNLNGTEGNQLSVALQSPQSGALWKLALLDWQEAGAMDVQASISTGKTIALTLDASMGEQKITADVAFTQSDIPELTGDIALTAVDLGFMDDGKEADVEKTSPEPAPPDNAKRKRVFSNDPLPWDTLNNYKANLRIRLANIDTGYNRIVDATLSPTLSGGRLTLSDAVVTFDHSEVRLDTLLDAAQNRLQFQLELDSNDYGSLGLEPLAGISKGSGGLRIDLSSSGQSPAALANALDGEINMKVRDLRAKAGALDIIGSDVLAETINKLNPFAEKRDYTAIECLAVHLKGNNGDFFSKQGLAVETSSSKFLGTGEIDLGKETLQLSVTPIARQGVGVNLGAAASLVRLGGTFSQPKVEVDPAGLLSSGLSTGAAIYTGGLSILAQGLLKRALYSGSACDGALKENPTLDELPEQIDLPQPEGVPGESTPGTAAPAGTSPDAAPMNSTVAPVSAADESR